MKELKQMFNSIHSELKNRMDQKAQDNLEEYIDEMATTLTLYTLFLNANKIENHYEEFYNQINPILQLKSKNIIINHNKINS